MVGQDRVVVVGTKLGEVCFVDLRRPGVVFSFAAHDSAVRTLCVDLAADCLITGGADSNVKVGGCFSNEVSLLL